jgi:hypothetical protein
MLIKLSSLSDCQAEISQAVGRRWELTNYAIAAAKNWKDDNWFESNRSAEKSLSFRTVRQQSPHRRLRQRPE